MTRYECPRCGYGIETISPNATATCPGRNSSHLHPIRMTPQPSPRPAPSEPDGELPLRGTPSEPDGPERSVGEPPQKNSQSALRAPRGGGMMGCVTNREEP